MCKGSSGGAGCSYRCARGAPGVRTPALDMRGEPRGAGCSSRCVSGALGVQIPAPDVRGEPWECGLGLQMCEGSPEGTAAATYVQGEPQGAGFGRGPTRFQQVMGSRWAAGSPPSLACEFLKERTPPGGFQRHISASVDSICPISLTRGA